MPDVQGRPAQVDRRRILTLDRGLRRHQWSASILDREQLMG